MDEVVSLGIEADWPKASVTCEREANAYRYRITVPVSPPKLVRFCAAPKTPDTPTP